MADTLEQIAGKGLGEVFQAGIPYVRLNDSSKAYAQNPTDTKALELYARLRTPYQTKEAIESMIAELKKMAPALVKERMDEAVGEIGKDLVTIVAKNYENMAKGLKGGYLPQMALAVSGKAEKAMKIKEAIKNEQLGEVRKIYAEARKSKDWQNFIATASEEFIKTFAQVYFDGEANQFLSDFAEIKKDKEGKEYAEINSEKLSKYILENHSRIKDEKERAKLYLRVGKGLAQYQIEEEEKAQKEAEKKAKEKEKKDKNKKK
jgi:hypothetical protein